MNDVIELPNSTSLGAIGQPLRRKAPAVHRGLVADQHASRLARGDHLRWLYARRGRLSHNAMPKQDSALRALEAR